MMIDPTPHAPHDAERLLGHYEALSITRSPQALVAAQARAVAQLTGCELSQVYLLDASHARLELHAQCLDDQIAEHEPGRLPADYSDQSLLHFCLSQNRVMSLVDLNTALHETTFLPTYAQPWRALLCLPLLDPRQKAQGLLLCASTQCRELGGFSTSLQRLGTFMLAQRPWREPAVITHTVAMQAPAMPCPGSYGLIGESPAMRQTYRMIGKVLHSPYTVLLNGETGTGKELVARAIHERGPRRTKPFIVQNCSALPEHLLESELFGYRKGAFTGANRDHAGLFDAADGGTLFLDEVGDMPQALQAKLLRVLQEGEVRPLGTTRTHRIDVRIVAATHRDLRAMAKAGEFREDLYYRLAQFPIELPPLRERGEDIPQLARYFADKACALLEQRACQWSDAALMYLATYAFPGNVRELKAMVERAVLLCDNGELHPEHFALQPLPTTTDRSLSLREQLDRVERTLLIDCLRKHGGNRTLAAQSLGLPRRTLLYRLGRLDIPPTPH